MHPSINTLIKTALNEDKARQDITTRILVAPDQQSRAVIIAREGGIVCGTAIVKEAFRRLDRRIRVVAHLRDGQSTKKGQKIFSIQGKTRAILSAERTALNFLSHLSGIATLTSRFVRQVRGLKAQILDTRKTTPGLRLLEKMAVACGGGRNHRLDLSDMVLIKDNHRVAEHKYLTLRQAIKLARQKTRRPIEVEVDNLNQFTQALAAEPDIILLDNMTTTQLAKAVRIRAKLKSRCRLEASGGINLHNVRAVARTGVDRISIGALTHSVKSIDFSLEFLEN